jgi:hypothetical protein
MPNIGQYRAIFTEFFFGGKSSPSLSVGLEFRGFCSQPKMGLFTINRTPPIKL